MRKVFIALLNAVSLAGVMSCVSEGKNILASLDKCLFYGSVSGIFEERRTKPDPSYSPVYNPRNVVIGFLEDSIKEDENQLVLGLSRYRHPGLTEDHCYYLIAPENAYPEFPDSENSTNPKKELNAFANEYALMFFDIDFRSIDNDGESISFAKKENPKQISQYSFTPRAMKIRIPSLPEGTRMTLYLWRVETRMAYGDSLWTDGGLPFFSISREDSKTAIKPAAELTEYVLV